MTIFDRTWDRFTEELLCRRIVEGAPDAVIAADQGGTIRYWNGGAERLFGFSPGEALGRSLDLIIPERHRQRHWDGFFKTMETGQTRYGNKLLAVPALHRSGEQISVEFSVVLLKDDDGQPRGVAAILRDVTERWQREKGLRDRLRALESTAGS